MSVILYGNLRVEIRDQSGARLDRLGLRDALPRFPRPVPPPAGGQPRPLARDEQVREAYAGVRAQRPVEFAATCGWGKSTLLRHIAANAAREGIGGPCVYLNAGPGKLEDLLQRIVTELYVSALPFKATPEECTQLLGQARALIVLDDLTLDPADVTRLVGLLPGCGLILGCDKPVLGRNGTSRLLAGLPDGAALELVTREIGRQLTASERSAVERLSDAVEGQPLHLRQAAALNREDGLSFERLAQLAERDAGELDRLSIRRLAAQERRALAVLALAAGALLPADLVGAMADITSIGVALDQLRRRGLAEQKADRFELPVCKRVSYREMTLKDLNLAAALRELASYLANRDPGSADSLSAAGAALAVIEWAAELGDWPAVTSLTRVAEPVLTLAGRWEASRHLLDQGVDAAKAAGDRAAEALFTHGQGTLAFCVDDLGPAVQFLEQALSLREQLGDQPGADLTRHNLELLQPPPKPTRPGPGRGARSLRRTALAVGGALVALLVLGLVVKATVFHSSGSSPTSPVSSTTKSVVASQSQGTATTPPPGSGSQTTAGQTTAGQTTAGQTTAGQTTGGTTPALEPPSAPAQTGFGDVDISAPANVTVTVTNPNAQPLPISNVTVSGGPAFSQTSTCVGTLPANQSCSVSVQFAPSGLGASTGSLEIESAGGDVTTQLSGTGYALLTVTVQGTGSGSVDFAGGVTQACSQTCSAKITSVAGDSVSMTASPDDTATPSTAFDGWGGACADTDRDLTCTLTVTADTQASVDFESVQVAPTTTSPVLQ